MIRRKTTKKYFWAILFVFAGMNLVAFIHAYKFTHFTDRAVVKTKDPSKLSVTEKLNALAFGVDNPRPQNQVHPPLHYRTIQLKSTVPLEGWYIQITKSKGTVLLFHGYSGAKSLLLDKASEFMRLGYSVFLLDFRGSGGSAGSQTTIGFDEAADVYESVKYIQNQGEKNIYLFGTSMGAVAIMKAFYDFSLQPKGIILECPFGSMYQTTVARFHNMHVPPFPMASLLVFWGGIQNGFWAFGHNPTKYAKNIHCPTLLMYGEKDANVSRQEINDIYANLQGQKILRTYPLAGHDNYLKKYKKEWIQDIKAFLPS
ncbi:alpha/beta hydrolase [Xanthocytophaga agilis]|uniref:Alpha/beta fold hydrolase n=1 Tax=Xanthocytophaga agilis TaxID=3048010 RepID=A0AAE3QWF7_9BACT|nr:alpha/beta fold hydrolase [Xanthocytophaga agilis]MDJ1499221.1 alpha/beta fold hydrolase [Xanthocytophaga agilis]